MNCSDEFNPITRNELLWHNITQQNVLIDYLYSDTIMSDFASKTKVDSRFIKLIYGLSITHVDWQLI